MIASLSDFRGLVGGKFEYYRDWSGSNEDRISLEVKTGRVLDIGDLISRLQKSLGSDMGKIIDEDSLFWPVLGPKISARLGL